MATKINITPLLVNEQPTQPSLEARAFSVAFLPDPPQTNITKLWTDQASTAIAALTDFRSALHRWTAAGRIDPAEFTAEAQRLTEAGLADWLDDRLALAMLIDEAAPVQVELPLNVVEVIERIAEEHQILQQDVFDFLILRGVNRYLNGEIDLAGEVDHA